MDKFGSFDDVLDYAIEREAKHKLRFEIELVALDTHKAVAKFNELSEQRQNVAAALHLTC